MEKEETGAKEKKYLFCWEEVPGNDEERLRGTLKDDYDIDWAENPKIR